MKPIYLDYNATTPVDPRVVEAMLPHLTEDFGNAASIDHFYGHAAQQAVERAREQVAALIGADPSEIVFTSGATEADNIAILGAAERAGDEAEVLVSAIEHPAVLEAARRLGDRAKIIPVSGEGIVDPAEVRRSLTAKTALVSVMSANNETGAIQPMEEIGTVCAETEIPLHTDAAQALRHLDLDVERDNVSALSMSSHKVYGPKGVGALYVRKRRRRMKLTPLHFGGGQERGLRPGTANVPGIVGFGLAAELAGRERELDSRRESDLKRVLITALGAAGEFNLNAPAAKALPQTVSVRFHGVGARALMHAMRDHLAFSSGSACATTKVEPSHVLLAQGLPPEAVSESVRLSFGRFTTDAEIGCASEALVTALASLRRVSAVA
ncbi:MAG TPA: cysteine desulfurase family protein [Solirubrobacterales bacterium]|nr:cysteine desulfurase family protein [Solirubrobacterales bacterium]